METIYFLWTKQSPPVIKNFRVSGLFHLSEGQWDLMGVLLSPGIQDPQTDRKGEKPKEIFQEVYLLSRADSLTELTYPSSSI